MDKEYKSLQDISWNVTEEEYRADEAISYSTLSRFNREGFQGLDKLFDKIESPSLVFGSVVDTLLTGTESEFKELFMVAELPSISDALITIATKLFDIYSNTYTSILDIPKQEIQRIGKECDFYANDRYADYRAKKIYEECADYYKILFLSRGKTLISTELYNKALDCKNELKNNSATKFYFQDNNPFDRSIERFYQLKFKGEYKGIKVRCMADLIIVDHTKKEITPCDLKTSGHKEYEFHKSFITWNYYIQAQLYWYIIRQNLDKDPIFKDYKLNDYKFIVINKDSLNPLVWEFTNTKCICDIEYGTKVKYTMKNWRGILKELDYYLNNRPSLPIGIKEINNIEYWLNHE